MRKAALFKPVLLVVMLALLLALIVAVISYGFADSPVRQGRTRTFLDQFIIAGGHIVWFVLLPMSLLMVYLAVENALLIRRKRLVPDDVGEKVAETIEQLGPERFSDQAGSQEDLVTTAVAKALARGADDWFKTKNILAESLQDQAMALLRRIEWLNLVGSVSPMVGLFGTVFGMIKLFNVIVAAGGQPQAAQLADGISVALVTTFWGLLIAIPALAIHAVLRNRIETLVNNAAVELEDIMPRIRASLKRPGPVGKVSKQPISIEELADKSARKNRKSPLTTA